MPLNPRAMLKSSGHRRIAHNDNDYIVSKGDANLMKELKYWRMMDYFSLLVQIIKEGERHREQQKKKK